MVNPGTMPWSALPVLMPLSCNVSAETIVIEMGTSLSCCSRF